jgi:hypothetical protein
MAAMTIQSLAEAGATITYSAVSSSDTIADDGTQRTFLHVKNGGGSSINVTITAQQTSRSVPGMGAMTKSNQVVAVGAGAEKMIGPFPPDAYKDSSGLVNVAYSATTSVTAAAVKVPQLSQ